MQITGALDLDENPDKVNFPNPKACREIDKLKREIGDLQEKCKECNSKNPGGDPGQIPALEKGVESLKRGLNATIDRIDQVLSHQKKDHAKIQEIQQALDCTRDELAAWAVHLQQQQQQLTPREKGETPSAMEEPYQAPTTVLTEMANKGDIEIEVTDPDNYPVGKFIVIQESLIYLIQGKGSLILERPLCRDFLVGTPVRLLNDADQYRTEDNGEIYLQNPYQSHSHNGEQGNPRGSPQAHSHHEGQGNLRDSHGQNGDGGTPRHIEMAGMEGNSHCQNGAAGEASHSDRLPCGKPKPPIERAGAPVRDLTLTTWLLRSQFQQVKEHWRQCYEYYRIHQPTPAQLDYDNRFKPTDIDNALKRVKFPPSTGSVLVVIQGIRDFEGQLVRAMKGLSQACVLYAKLLMHGVYVDLEKLQSKKTAAERQALVFDEATEEEQFMQILESRVHAWLTDQIPKDIQTKASNRTNTLSARMLIVEYYYTAIPGPDAIGMNMSKSIRVPTNTATTAVEVLANIESWKTSIQINHEVTQTMPSQQEIRLAFQRLISPLKVADEDFKFHQNLLVSQTFGTQKVSDEDVLKYFQQTEEKIHSMDTRKQLKFPDRSPPSKTNAINTPDSVQKPKGKGNSRSQSVPPPKAGQQQKGVPQKKGDKGPEKSSEGKPQPKASVPPKAPSPTAASTPPPKPGGGNNSNRTEKRQPGTIKKQCVPYTLPSGCVNGNNCPFQHANDPVTKKPVAPLPEDVKRYQAALKRNPSLADPKAASSSGANKPPSSAPTIRMIRVITPEESEEEPDPEQPVQVEESSLHVPRAPGDHPNPEGPVDMDELTQQFSNLTHPDPVCRHMRSRSYFADVIFGGNQHGRWLNCRHCGVRGAIQTLSLMSCVNCSLARIYRPENDRRRTCVWTRWLTMIARYRFRMSDPERAYIRERILRCQDRRRMRAAIAPQPVEGSPVREEPERPSRSLRDLSESELWEHAVQVERSSLLALQSSQPANRGASSSSGSTQVPARELIEVSNSPSSPFIVTTRHWRGQTLPRGQAFQIHTRTGRTRLISTGDFVPETTEADSPTESEEDRRVSAVSVGAVTASGSEDHYCMLDSGANVMVIPWREGMEGDHTMCALVGDNKTEGLVVARLATRHRTHLIVAVKGAKPLIPISYLIRIAHYRAIWRMMGEHDCFQMKDGYGDPVMVNEEEDLLYVGKTTLWRIGHDLYNSALHTTGMTWSEVWKTLTGEDAPIRSIFAIQTQTNVDFVELYNPGNFTANKGELIAGTVIDCKVNPQLDLTSSQVRQEVALLIEKEDPLFLIGAPPCTVFSSMQNINHRHHVGEVWEVKYQQGLSHLEYAVRLYWEQISRGRFFLHEHPATATSWGLSMVKELERHPGVQVVTGDMCRWGMTLSLSGSRWLRWVGLVLGKGCSLTPPYFASASPGPKSREPLRLQQKTARCVARGEGCRSTRGSTGLGATVVRPRL